MCRRAGRLLRLVSAALLQRQPTQSSRVVPGEGMRGLGRSVRSLRSHPSDWCTFNGHAGE